MKKLYIIELGCFEMLWFNLISMGPFFRVFILYSPVENKNDLELDFKVFFFTDSCCSDIVHDESN